MDKIVIPLDNGYSLVAKRNTDSDYNKEIFIGICSDKGIYIQDLAIIRPTYKNTNDSVVFSSDKFELLIFGDKENDDITNMFTVGLRQDDEWANYLGVFTQ